MGSRGIKEVTCAQMHIFGALFGTYMHDFLNPYTFWHMLAPKVRLAQIVHASACCMLHSHACTEGAPRPNSACFRLLHATLLQLRATKRKVRFLVHICVLKVANFWFIFGIRFGIFLGTQYVSVLPVEVFPLISHPRDLLRRGQRTHFNAQGSKRGQKNVKVFMPQSEG